ncbi:MAG: tryptophan 7-halogenase [Rhodopirellula sp.]|nr:tryptophan 7-halogenase [Rhodopirellula sp.]
MTNSRPSNIRQHATLTASAESSFDFVVIGSGFAGSLLACILQSRGRRVAIIDRSGHPRFAIGESSTPAASLILSGLADQYDLPWLRPFAKYGTWKKSYPNITTGRKRGFSYFQHEPGQPFQPRGDHSNELLAAASSSDAVSDTQWLRSDVDAFFFRKACESGVASFQNSQISDLHQSQTGWIVEINESAGQQIAGSRMLSASFLIDASGAGQVLAKHLNIKDQSDQLATSSRAIFAHVTGLPEWHAILEQATPGSAADHPFHCDHAAQHHVLEEGWMWWLRFDSDVTSVGLVLDNRESGSSTVTSPNSPANSSHSDTEFFRIINRYPSLSDAFLSATVVAPLDQPVQTQRLQRLAGHITGDNWAMLPHTAGFIDPLHSTGIAHSLAGVEQLASILLTTTASADNQLLASTLRRYGSTIREELTLIDQIVAGCYDAIAERSFRKFTAFTMCYFAAATTWERRCLHHTSPAQQRRARSGESFRPALLCADIPEFRAVVFNLRGRLPHETDESFEILCTETLAPFNHVGLFEPPVPNMYGATAVPEGSEHLTLNIQQ